MLFGKLTQGYVILAFHQAPMRIFVSIHFKTSKDSSFTWHQLDMRNF